MDVVFCYTYIYKTTYIHAYIFDKIFKETNNICNFMHGRYTNASLTPSAVYQFAEEDYCE